MGLELKRIKVAFKRWAEQRKSYNGSFESIRSLVYTGRVSAGVHEEAVLNSDRPRMKQMVKPLIEIGFV